MAVASPSDEYSSSSDLPSPNPELHFPFYKLQDTPSEYPEFPHNANTAVSRVLTERLHRKLAKRQTSGGFTFDMCIESGVEYPTDFRAGCLAGDKDSYVAFGPLFKQIIMDSHQGYDIDRFQHQNSFLDQSFEYFDATIDLDYFKSCRIRADRSLFGFNFPVHQGKSDRVTVERILVRACNNIENEDYHGAYSNFKDIDEDFLCQLRSHYGIKRSKYCVDDYPNNRGVFASSDNRFSVWMNEDEHCSIVCASVEANLNDVFTHMANALDIVETELVKQGCKFLEDDKLGYMLCNPLSTGTGLEISVIVQFRLLHRFVQFSEILENLRLHSRSVNFEEGIICLSNVDRIGYSEIETMKLVVSGVNRLINLEKALSVKQNIADSIPAPIYPPWSPLKTKSSLATRLKQAHATHERLKLLGSAPETVVVSGRKGTNNIVNGVYLKGEDTFNGRPYYERCGLEASVFLRYHSSGLWIFSEDLSNSLHGYAKFRSTAQYPHLIREVILIFYENMFKIDWNVTVKEHDGLNYQPLLNTDTHWEAVSFKMFPEESLNEASTAPTYRISRHVSREKKLGRRKTLLEDLADEEPQNCFDASQYLEIPGNHPLISGKYSLVEGRTHDGRCYWKKSDGSYNCYIRWHHQGLWIISDFLTEGRRGYALVQDNAADPTMVENEWKVLQNKKYQYQPGFRVIIDAKSILVE